MKKQLSVLVLGTVVVCSAIVDGSVASAAGKQPAKPRLGQPQLLDISSVSGRPDWVGKVRMLPNGRGLVYAPRNANTVEILDFKTGKRIGRPIVLPRSAVWHVSRDSKSLWFVYGATFTGGNRIARVDLQTGERTEVCTLPEPVGHYGSAALEIAPNRLIVGTCRADAFAGAPLSIVEVDLLTGRTTTLLTIPYESGAYSITYSYDLYSFVHAAGAGELWFSMSLSGTGRWYLGRLNLKTRSFRRFHVADRFHSSLAVSPDGTRALIFLAGWGRQLAVLDAKTGAVQLRDVPDDGFPHGSVFISPNGRYGVVLRGGSRYLTVLDFTTGKSLTVHSGGANYFVGFSPNGRWLLTTNIVSSTLKFFDLSTGEKITPQREPLKSTGRVVMGKTPFVQYTSDGINISYIPWNFGPPALSAADRDCRNVLLCYGSPIYRIRIVWP